MKQTTDAVNEKHMTPWRELCKEHGILNTVLSPYLYQELLYDNWLCVDGSAITESGAFHYAVPAITADTIRASIAHHVVLKLFPPIVE
jgi:hypothetical protein